MQNKLPRFEANQVLSNKHLNDFVDYLEEQGRFTRNHLLGAGIVSGLDVKRSSATTVSIYEGAGITSAGYLVIPGISSASPVDDKGRRFITYNRKRKYEPKNLLSHLTRDYEKLVNEYSLFAGTNPNAIFSLIESTDPATTDTNVSQLSAGDLNDHVMILFFETRVKELKNCEGDNCIEFGKELGYNIVPLLVSKTDVDIILKNENDQSSSLDGAAAISLAWQMNDLSMPKPDLTAIDGDSIHEELAFVYAKALGQLIKKLEATNSIIDNSLKKILKTNIAAIGNFHKKLTDITVNTPVQKNPGIYQYVYDFACDFLSAYRELQDAVNEFTSYDMPSANSFPYHIRLGEVPPANAITNSFNFPPSSYRHTFVDTRNVERQQKAFYSVQVLFARLSSLIDNFKPDLKKDDIRITPSVEPGTALSEKAIPFYYAEDENKRSTLVPVWNSQYNRQGKQSRILNYFTNANTATKDKFSDSRDINKDEASFFPLMYNQDVSNFYRIEGYSGQQLGEVFQGLRTYINQYNLPFDLQLVGLNKATQLVIREMRLRFNDLDSMYNVMCEEVLCLLTTELNYFKNVRLTRRIFTTTPIVPTATIATLEDEEDPLTKINLPIAGNFFFKSERQKSTIISKAAPKAVQTLNLGVKDSTADIAERLGAKVPTRNLGNIIGSVGTRFIPTPASPYILKLIAAIEKLIDTLREDFDEFDGNEFKECLREMHTETKEFITFLKPQSIEALTLNSNMDRDESLGYLERLLYECDFEKMPAIDDERDKREKELGYNNNLSQYILQNPGLEHKAGVWKGGTFVIVFDRTFQVIADFCLPYKCCGGMNTTQYVLGVLQTLWFDGQVVDKDGAPVEKAKVILNNEELPVDKNGRFRKIIPPNTYLILKVSADGFEPTEVVMTSTNENISHTIKLLKKTEIPKVTLTIKVANSASEPLADVEVKADDVTAKTNNTGQASLQVKANAGIQLSISKQGFIPKNDTVTTQTKDVELSYNLIKIIKLSGTIVDFSGNPVMNAKVLIDDKLVTINGNKYEAELTDNKTYRVTAEAPDQPKFTEEFSTKFDDLVREIKFQSMKILTVRVGIYKSTEPPRQPTPPPQPTLPPRRAITTLAETRATGFAGAFTVRRAATPVERFADRRVEFDPGILVRPDSGPRTPTVPPTSIPDKFSLLDDGGASSSIADKFQQFKPNLRVFESSEKMDTYKLVVRDRFESMEFGTFLTVGDRDILVLIHSAKGKQAEAQISFLISSSSGINMIDKFNEVMSNALGLAGTQKLAISNDSVELIMFTRSDANEIREILKKNNIAIAREIELPR